MLINEGERPTMNISFSTEAGLIIIGAILLLLIVPGVTEFIGALLGRQVPSVWRNSTKIIFAIGGIFFIGIGLVLTFKTASPEPPVISTASPTGVVTSMPNVTPTLILLPTETLTPSPSPTLEVGQDFEAGCIDSKYWTPYKAETRPRDFKGCWDLSTMGISAQDGGLVIVGDNVEGYTRSIYTTLPANAEVQFTVRIDKLSTVREVDSSLVFGIGNPEQWLLKGKYVIYRVISPNSPVYMFVTDSVLNSGEKFFPNYTYGQEHKIVFDIHGLLLDLHINGSNVLESIALSQSDKKVFWIGSWVSNNGSIKVFVKDFRVIEK